MQNLDIEEWLVENFNLSPGVIPERIVSLVNILKAEVKRLSKSQET